MVSTAPSLASSPPDQRPALAIGFALLAVALFAIMDGIAKHASQSIRVEMVIWGRYFFHLLGMVLLLPWLGTRRCVAAKSPALLVLRGLLLLGCTVCFFVAISEIPLADANAIGFVAPLMTVALSVLVLKEKVGIRRWSAVIAGFAGVLVILRPGFQEIHWAYILVLVMALLFAAFSLMTRALGRSEDPIAMLFYTALVGGLGASLALPFVWTEPSLAEWAFLAAVGLIGGSSHLVLIHAYRLGPASLIAPYQYTQIAWSIALGALLFGDLPDAYTLLGTSIIIAAGLYVLLREAQLKRRAALAAEAAR